MKLRLPLILLGVIALVALLNLAVWRQMGKPSGRCPAEELARLPRADLSSPPAGDMGEAPLRPREEALPLSWLTFNETRISPGPLFWVDAYPFELLAARGRMVRMVGLAALRKDPQTDLIDGLLRPARLDGCCGQVCEHPLLQTVYVVCAPEQPWPVVSPIPLASVTGVLSLEEGGSMGYFYMMRETIAEPMEIPELEGAGAP